jgi:L-lactate dehydrogenase complex protein LldG
MDCEPLEIRAAMTTVLKNIRAALGDDVATRREGVAHWVARRAGLPAGPAAVSDENALDRFVAKAKAAACNVEVLRSGQDVAAALSSALDRWGVVRDLVAARDPLLRGWLDGATEFTCRFDNPTTTDPVGVALPVAAAAETGTLVFQSGPASPTAVAFLPDCLIAIVPRSRILMSYEEALARLLSPEAGSRLPTRIHFVTGPSRTADIEEVLLLGAHGPRKLCILILDHL